MTESKWSRLLDGTLSAEETESLVTEAVAQLESFLESDLEAEQRVLDILARRLNTEINASTWEVMHASLSQYFTEELVSLLYWVVHVQDPFANRLADVKEYSSSKVMAFLRSLVGVYGVDLTNAYEIWNEIPDNWRRFDHEVFYDVVRGRHRVRLKIEKYNGEEVFIEGPPDLLLNLASALLYTAIVVGTAEAFSEGSVSRYLERAEKLEKLLMAENAELPTEAS